MARQKVQKAQKEQEQELPGKVLKMANLAFEIKELKTKSGEILVVTTLRQKGADGRMWTSNVSGQGKDRDSALEDLHANLARRPHQISSAAKRALEAASVGAITQEELLSGKVQLSPEKAGEISERAKLKKIISDEHLEVKIPFGCSNEKLKELITLARTPKPDSEGF